MISHPCREHAHSSHPAAPSAASNGRRPRSKPELTKYSSYVRHARDTFASYEGRGSIISVASICGPVGAPGTTACATDRGGIVNPTRRSPSTAPVRSPRQPKSVGDRRDPGDRAGCRGGTLSECDHGHTYIRRTTEPEEIAEVAVFLASDEYVVH